MLVALSFILSMNFCLGVLTPAVALPSNCSDGIFSNPYILAISSYMSASCSISNLNAGTSITTSSADFKSHLNSKSSNIFTNPSNDKSMPIFFIILDGFTVKV